MYYHFVVYSALKTTLHAAACITPTCGWGHQSHPGVWRTKPQHKAHSSTLWETETWKTPEKSSQISPRGLNVSKSLPQLW